MHNTQTYRNARTQRVAELVTLAQRLQERLENTLPDHVASALADLWYSDACRMEKV